VLEALSSLVDKSLVRTDEAKERFSLLQTIGGFAAQTLEDSGEAENVKRAHAEFFRALAAESYPAFAGAHQLSTLGLLRREQENLRAALEWATGAQSWIALDLCSNLWPLWRIDGQVAEGRKWLERSLQVSDAPPIVRARALRGLSVIAEMHHDYERAGAAAVEAMGLFEQRQDEAGVARCLEMLASLAEEVGDYDEAVRHYSRTREISEKLGNRHGVAATVANLANVALLRQDYDTALELILESKQLFAEQADIDGMAVASLNEGLAFLGSGRPSESRPCLRRALALAEQLHHKELMATALEGLAAEGALTGDAERAARLLGAASNFRSDENALRDSLEERLYEEALRRVRQALVAHEFDRLFRDGRRQATETVVAEAKGV
jgi:tetratricopeptide (TPR) repeat protein